MSSKSIYPTDLIAEALNMRPLGYELDNSIPEDATSDVPKGMPWDYYFPGDVHPFVGKTHSKEYKQKLSKLMKEKRKANPELFLHNQPHTQETKDLCRERMMGNTNKLGKGGQKLSKEFGEAVSKRMKENNPMSNPESIEKVRQKALRKFPCKTCGKEMNKGNLSRHELKCK